MLIIYVRDSYRKLTYNVQVWFDLLYFFTRQKQCQTQ